MAGQSKLNNIWLTAIFNYLGYPLLSVSIIDRATDEFVVAIPELDAAILQEDFQSGKLALADAKAFVSSYRALLQIVKDLKRSGEIQWTSPAWQRGEIG